MNRLLHIVLFIFIIAIPLPQYSAAQSAGNLYPVIERLDFTDLNYRQLQEDIEFYYKAAGAGKELPPLLFYSYSVDSDINIFSISSQSGLTYETIATFNRISSTADNLENRTLLLPSQPGIFLPETPATDLEFIAMSWRAPLLQDSYNVSVEGNNYFFFPGESFHNVERAFFLRILFANPLPEGIVTSKYGYRKSPFTGHNTFHNGIDIAAPEGTEVRSARDGIISLTGFNETYGNFIQISHSGGYETFYGHLNKIFVELHDKVNSTMIIAEVGSTGLSTGPHLHFEVRRDGRATDPSSLTPGLD